MATARATSTELILQTANEAYRKDGTLLTNPAVKSSILEKLAESIFVYMPYPSNAEREQVAVALVAKNPCLRDPVSFNGLYSWHNSLKDMLGKLQGKFATPWTTRAKCKQSQEKGSCR